MSHPDLTKIIKKTKITKARAWQNRDESKDNGLADGTLDHLCSTHRDAYKALPRPTFGKSDHNSILWIPAYKQKLKQEVPVTSSIRKWSDDTDAKLQDCFARSDWNMFRDSSYGTTSITGFINNCTNEVIPTVNVRTYPNQKPWITGNICTELKG